MENEGPELSSTQPVGLSSLYLYTSDSSALAALAKEAKGVLRTKKTHTLKIMAVFLEMNCRVHAPSFASADTKLVLAFFVSVRIALFFPLFFFRLDRTHGARA